MGVWGRRLVYCTVYLTIMGEPIIFHLTSMEALQQIFYRSRLSQGLAAAIVAAIMLPLGQVSTLITACPFIRNILCVGRKTDSVEHVVHCNMGSS